MTTPDQDLDRELTALFAAELDDDAAGDHPEAGALLAYLAGELDDGAADELRRHLVACQRCTALLLDLEPLAAPDAPRADGVADLARASDWRQVRQVLDAERVAAAATPGTAGTRRTRFFQVAAALLLASTLALAVRVVRLGDEVERLAAPRADVRVAYLDSTRDEGDATLVLRPADDLVVVVITPGDPDRFSSYRVEIAEATGRPVWTAEGLELSEYATLRLALRRSSLAAGDYRLRVLGYGAGTEEVVDQRSLEVR